jgi:hypothetical protein
MFGINFGGFKKKAPEGEFVIARLNARVQPIDRGDYFEDPLGKALSEMGLGEVTGGGTQLADEPAGIEFCDVEICLSETTDEALTLIAARLEQLGAPKGSRLIVEADGREIPFGVMEGMAVYINGNDLPDSVYAECDFDIVIEEFNKAMGEKGKCRGHWHGSRESGIYCYGPSYAAMKAAIASFLASYPLCEGARVEQIA